MPNADPFTAAAADRMDALFQRRADIGLTPDEDAELLRLVDGWQHAYYLAALALGPDGWAEATARRAERDSAEADT